ncbi:MAG: hypothetical protein JKX68_08870 [Flavobacteriales bacterium]|nr:hypothetical protein [Flavobacteriales bacterium]
MEKRILSLLVVPSLTVTLSACNLINNEEVSTSQKIIFKADDGIEITAFLNKL